MNWPQIKKIILKCILLLLYAKTTNYFVIKLWCVMTSEFYMDSRWLQTQCLDWEETPKHFPKPNLHQKKGSRSPFGGLLLIPSATAFWPALELLLRKLKKTVISILQALKRKWRTHKDVWGISAKRNCKEESDGTVRKTRQELKQYHNERLKRAFNELISRLNTASRRIQGNMKTGYCLDYTDFLCYISLSFSSDLYYYYFF